MGTPVESYSATPFTVSSIIGTTLTTSSSPPLVAGMNIYGIGISIETTIVSGSGDSWIVSISQTVDTTITGYYQSNSFSIVSISGNIMTTSGNPNLGYGWFQV